MFLTDQRKAHALQKQEAAVKERMQAVLDASPMLCIIADGDGNLVDVNKEAENMFGIPNKQMLVNNFKSFLPPHQPDGSDSLQKTAEQMKQAIETRQQTRYEYIYRRSDGTPLPTGEIVTPISVGGKTIIICYSCDMRAEYTAKEAEQAAQKRLKTMTDRLNGQLETQSAAITESSAAIEEMVANTRSVSNTLSKNAQSVKELQEAAAKKILASVAATSALPPSAPDRYDMICRCPIWTAWPRPAA